MDWQTIIEEVSRIFGPLSGWRRKSGGAEVPAAQDESDEVVFTVPATGVALIGRDAEIEEILGFFANGERTVLVHGLSGVGKSALATEIAHAMREDRERFTDVTDFYWTSAKAADETEQRDKAWLVDRIYRSLGFAETSESPGSATKEEKITRALSDRGTLFLIDNFESFSDPAAIRYLLELPSDTRLLITSRVSVDPTLPLRSYALRPLDPEMTRELLLEECERAAIVPPSEEECSRIAAATGGSPLAIGWTVGLLREGYATSRALAVLRDGRDDLFKAIFADHWEGLQPNGRATLCGSALLGETFSRNLLDGFFESPADVSELLRRRLVDHWDESSGARRLTLHPLTRTFAAARATDEPFGDGLVFVLARTLAAYFDQRRLLQEGRPDYLALEYDIPSVLKVAARLVPRLDATVPDAPACVHFIRLFEAVSVPLWTFGYWSDRIELGRLAAFAAEVTGDADAATRAAATVAIVKHWQSDTNDAEAYGRRALDFARGSSDLLDVAIGNRVLALTMARRGDVDEAVHSMEQILGVLEQRKRSDPERVRFFADWPCGGARGHESGIVALNQETGIMLINAGRYSESLLPLEVSRDLAAEIDDEEGLSISLSHLGRGYAGLDELDSAETCFNAGLDLAVDVGRRSTTGRCLLGLAGASAARRRRDEAVEFASEAEGIFARLGMDEERQSAAAIVGSGGRRRRGSRNGT